MKRRAESDKQLQSHFEAEIKTLQERQLQQFSDLQLALKSTVESLNQRISDLHTLVRCAPAPGLCPSRQPGPPPSCVAWAQVLCYLLCSVRVPTPLTVPSPRAPRDERESRRSDIEHLATSLVGKVNECVAAIDEGGWLGRGRGGF